MSTKKTDPRRVLEQMREGARQIDQAIGHGSRVLDLVQKIQNTPPRQLLGAALQGIGKALEKDDPPRRRPR